MYVGMPQLQGNRHFLSDMLFGASGCERRARRNDRASV
jgi:hypothetical protein